MTKTEFICNVNVGDTFTIDPLEKEHLFFCIAQGEKELNVLLNKEKITAIRDLLTKFLEK